MFEICHWWCHLCVAKGDAHVNKPHYLKFIQLQDHVTILVLSGFVDGRPPELQWWRSSGSGCRQSKAKTLVKTYGLCLQLSTGIWALNILSPARCLLSLLFIQVKSVTQVKPAFVRIENLIQSETGNDPEDYCSLVDAVCHVLKTSFASVSDLLHYPGCPRTDRPQRCGLVEFSCVEKCLVCSAGFYSSWGNVSCFSRQKHRNCFNTSYTGLYGTQPTLKQETDEHMNRRMTHKNRKMKY